LVFGRESLLEKYSILKQKKIPPRTSEPSPNTHPSPIAMPVLIRGAHSEVGGTMHKANQIRVPTTAGGMSPTITETVNIKIYFSLFIIYIYLFYMPE
jgi:hypothetical protein